MPATPQTSVARTRTKLAAASLFIGTPLSIAVAMIGPVVLPQPSEQWYAKLGECKSTSWLTTIYSDDFFDGGISALEQVTEVRQRPYARSAAEYFGNRHLRIQRFSLQTCYVMESGFPWRSIAAWSIEDLEKESGPSESGVLALTAERTYPIEGRWIPLNPLWPGLLANAAAWSLAIALPLFAWAEGRRALRRRRNRCVACGYSRAGLEPTANCPECGGIAPPAASGIIPLPPRGATP